MWKPAVTSDDVLMHSRGPWKKHKYIKVVNGEYVYPGDSVKSNMDTINTEKLHDANMRKVLAKKNAEKAQSQGRNQTEYYKRIADENAERARRSVRLRDQRNAEGRLSTRKQIEAGNQRSRDEAARLRKLNAINTTRKAQRQGRNRTEYYKNKTEAEIYKYDIPRAAEMDKAQKRKALNERNLNAARSKAARVSKENQLRERGMERTKQLKKQNAAAATERSLEAARNKASRKAGAKRIADENVRRSKAKARAGVYRGAVNKDSEVSKRLSDFNRKLSKNTMYREFAKEKMYARSGDNEKARKARKNKEIAARVYNKGLMNERVSVNKGQSNGSWKMDDPRTRNKAKGKLPARLDVAAKQAGNAISREAYRTGYKARKAASSAAKSISSAAREAWNTASSYRDNFADFESFYKWYKKNVRK